MTAAGHLTLLQFLSTYALQPRSRSTYEGHLRSFCGDATIANMPLAQFTQQIILERLIEMTLAEEFGTSTCNPWNSVAAHLRAIFEAARHQGAVAYNPAAGLRLPAAKSRRDLYDALRQEFSDALRRGQVPCRELGSASSSIGTL
jgi:hypothetical protein